MQPMQVCIYLSFWQNTNPADYFANLIIVLRYISKRRKVTAEPFSWAEIQFSTRPLDSQSLLKMELIYKMYKTEAHVIEFCN